MQLSSSTSITVLKSSLFAVIVAGGLSFTPPAKADAALLRLATSLCEAAKNNDRTGMRKKLRSAKMRLKAIYYGIKCGPEGSLLRVATLAGSLDAATFLATKAGKKALTQKEDDGKSLIEFTESLVASGDASKQPFVELYKSKL